MDRIRDTFLKEGQHVVEHPNEFPCSPPKWKNQILKDGARRCAYKKDNALMITWTLTMQECELLINL